MFKPQPRKEMWEFKYAPQTFDDLIISPSLKPVLKKAIEERPNMLLQGQHGIGKGSFVQALINDANLKGNVLKINASDETSIDSIREKVKPFAQSMSLGATKLVFLNEADSLSSGQQGAQKMLRDLMEATQQNCQFILACNYAQYIIPELVSRCQVFTFIEPPATEIFEKCMSILEKENISFEKKHVLEVVKKSYPDIRNTIKTLQQNVIDGKLSSDVVVNSSDKIYQHIIDSINNKDIEDVRKTLRTYPVLYDDLYNYIYKSLMENDKVFKDDGQAILLIGEHHYRNSVVAIKEINFMHMVMQFMAKGVV